MEIYLVRHGETSGNLAKRHQAKDSELTFKGEKQAEAVAKVIKKYEPTHIVTSSMLRAVTTAEKIGKVCDLIPDTSAHFVELKRPKHLYGNYHRSLGSFWYYFQWYLGKTKNSEEMGESYLCLRKRITDAKKFLASFPEDSRVVVVSHSVFINLFVAHVCQETPLTSRQAVKTFRRILTMPNTKVSTVLFEHKAPNKTCAWMLQKN